LSHAVKQCADREEKDCKNGYLYRAVTVRSSSKPERKDWNARHASDRDASCSVRVAALRGSGLAVTTGPAHVELVASAEPNEMTTDDVLQVREISPDLPR
jgi:hypothetical protein